MKQSLRPALLLASDSCSAYVCALATLLRLARSRLRKMRVSIQKLQSSSATRSVERASLSQTQDGEAPSQVIETGKQAPKSTQAKPSGFFAMMYPFDSQSGGSDVSNLRQKLHTVEHNASLLLVRSTCTDTSIGNANDMRSKMAIWEAHLMDFESNMRLCGPLRIEQSREAPQRTCWLSREQRYQQLQSQQAGSCYTLSPYMTE